MTPEQKLPDGTARVLEYYQANMRWHYPTIREAAAALGIRSPNGIYYHLKKLERLGLIKRNGRVPRGIEVIA